jgi:predicted nucleic acid-binding protein
MILLDADVLLDVALDREPHAEAAGALLELLERRRKMAFVAWHTLSNFYYLVRPRRGADDARAFLVELTRFTTVAPTDADAFRYAAGLPLADLEDAMQVAAAWSCGAGVIATRNVKDFKRSPIPARTPAQLLLELG